MTTLKLEKRGCNFRDNSEESKSSDLGNFRLFGYIDPKDTVNKEERRGEPVKYWIEVCTNIQNNKFRKGIFSFFTVAYETEDGNQWGALEKGGLTDNATKNGILKYINRVMGSSFSKIEIVDNL